MTNVYGNCEKKVDDKKNGEEDLKEEKKISQYNVRMLSSGTHFVNCFFEVNWHVSIIPLSSVNFRRGNERRFTRLLDRLVRLVSFNV